MAYEVTVDGITISSNEELSEKECRAYIHYIQSRITDNLSEYHFGFF